MLEFFTLSVFNWENVICTSISSKKHRLRTCLLLLPSTSFREEREDVLSLTESSSPEITFLSVAMISRKARVVFKDCWHMGNTMEAAHCDTPKEARGSMVAL